ncbi:MAG TPA: hypothetical protein PLU53_15085 [Bacteroidia bacterium]|nr:hypothetical protein [Bacteroidia bacterium]
MKLIIEKHPELTTLVIYFKKIEAIAEKLGIDVDDLISESCQMNTSMYMSFKKKILTMAQKRAEVLRARNAKESTAEKSSIVGLTIMVNKERRN